MMKQLAPALLLLAGCADMPQYYGPPPTMPPPQYVPYQLPAPYQMPTNQQQRRTTNCTTTTIQTLSGPVLNTTCQ